jgi:hypothetical protein
VVVVGSTGYALVKEKRKIEGPSGEHGLAWFGLLSQMVFGPGRGDGLTGDLGQMEVKARLAGPK